MADILKHRLSPRLLQGPVKVLVVGAGGTGAAFCSGLPYLHQAMRVLGHPGGLDVTLADGDRISESNCVRQPFSRSEIGRNKAEVLVTRINWFWGLDWRASPHHVTVEDGLHAYHIVVGCVDTRAARAMLADLTRRTTNVHYWLDAGNGNDFGQVVLGEPPRGEIRPEGAPRLPTVAELLPDVVRAGPEDAGPSCSAAEALARQAPFVNHVVASHMLFLLGQLFRDGELDHHGVFLNLREGTTQRIPVDPEQWAVMMNTLPAGQPRSTPSDGVDAPPLALAA